MVFLVQKEVAQDYASEPPKAKFLSMYSKIYADVEYIKTVKKEDFKPQPKVDGGILRFKKTHNDLDATTKKKFAKFLKNAFQQPRKKLINTLSNINNVDKNIIKQLFLKMNLSENTRASEVEFQTWIKIFQEMQKV
jgi:16S rRNA A1518/A1519 N6-dimethyltransferase RsmA/KsgA/DIM1 with predicted DNA glycosylase/AP lyase activity